tara:strand:+ start:1077 stop:1463 length:387 start_codon:yes stop_codon:yes gene_type:complete
MTVDLWMLFWAVLLAFGQLAFAAAVGATQVDLPTLVGNRENMPARTGLAGRADRAHRNMMESLPLFAALVLVAHVAQLANAQTALGAQLFLYARLVYAVVYVAGIPWLRTLVWAAAVVGMGMIAAAFF